MAIEIRCDSWNELQRSVISFRIADDLQALLDIFHFLSCGLKHNQKITNIVIHIVAAKYKYMTAVNSMK